MLKMPKEKFWESVANIDVSSRAQSATEETTQ